MAYGLLGLKPWEFIRYTVREFEETVAGAHIRHAHAVDLVMRHALVTGQWSKPVSFRDLTGREEPLQLDPRGEAPEDAEAEDVDPERATLAWMKAMEMQIRTHANVTIEGE